MDWRVKVGWVVEIGIGMSYWDEGSLVLHRRCGCAGRGSSAGVERRLELAERRDVAASRICGSRLVELLEWW